MDLKKITKTSTAELKKLWNKHKDDEGISAVFGQQLKRVAQELKKRGEKLNERKEINNSMNENTETSIRKFIGNIVNKDYANAQITLEQVITEKMKNKVREIVNKSKKVSQKG
jgi:hypothetical protein